jgi:hypothetical protein
MKQLFWTLVGTYFEGSLFITPYGFTHLQQRFQYMITETAGPVRDRVATVLVKPDPLISAIKSESGFLRKVLS